MVLAVLVTTVWLSLIIAGRYLLIAGGVWWLQWGRGRGVGRRLNRERPSRAMIVHEIRYSLLSTPIYALPAAVALEAWKAGGTMLYVDPSAWPLWWLPVSFVLLLVVQDAHYYWTHRLLHHRRMFGWAHAGHHRSREPSPFASFAFDPAEAALTAWLLPALAFVVPLNLWMLAGLLTVMTATAVMNHCGWEMWPDRWVRQGPGALTITATHHSRHHTHMKTNYGLYFRVWDRLCGTDAMPPADPQDLNRTAHGPWPSRTARAAPQDGSFTTRNREFAAPSYSPLSRVGRWSALGENEMLKKFALAAFVMSSVMVAMPQAAVAGPEDGCNLNCVWFDERNESGDIIGGHWVCGVPICQDQVDP